MQFKVGYELIYHFPQPTPLILVVNVHDSRQSDIVVAEHPVSEPWLPITAYRDAFGNQCHRVLAPPGRLRLFASGIVNDSGLPDEPVITAEQDLVQDLPDENLVFLLGSRYCETDLLSETAWQLFSGTPPGYARVQAICDFVHNHIVFDYQNARATRTATETFNERSGVCRDYAHLAIAFCRCMNIPARYCTGYLSDAGTPLISDPGYKLVRSARKSGHTIHTLPGPSAAIAALTLAGLPTDRFLFLGFLPAKAKARADAIADVKTVRATLVLYESGPRLGDSLAAFRDGLGEREAAVVREISKLHEETVTGTLAELAIRYADAPPRGEIVIVIGPPPEREEASDDELDQALRSALATMSPSRAAADVAATLGVPRKRAYARALELGASS